MIIMFRFRLKKVVLLLNSLNPRTFRNIVHNKHVCKYPYLNNSKWKFGTFIAGFGAIYLGWTTYRQYAIVHAFRGKKTKEKEEEIPKNIKLTSREKHFIKFASVEYDGQIYMTPQDFLESFVEDEPRPRISRRVLTEKEIDCIRNSTPPLSKGSSQLFRALRDNEPQTGFRIAFNMFDTDGNQRVDKEEFLVMEKIFSHTWQDKHGESVMGKKRLDPNSNDGQNLQRKNNAVDTTLLIHFFGKKGTSTLQHEDFRRFMENLQTEVLEMEFQEFAKGADKICEVDFARILLRYTHLDTELCDMYLERLLNRLKELDEIPPGISFPEFKIFCQFLNNLEDFTIAMRMYTLADHPISKDEFHRAVKICTGTSLSPHLVQIVFAIFDEDGDGQLSYREFIAIMKDRLHRGFKSHTGSDGWEGFKACIKQEIKSPVARINR